MAPMIVDVQLSPRDWDAYQLYTTRRFAERFTPWRERVLPMLLATIAVVVGVAGVRLIQGHFDPISIIAGLLMGAVGMVIAARRRLKLMRPDASSNRLAPTRYEIDATGVRTERAHQSTFIVWAGIEHIEETAEHVFLTVDKLSSYVIPKRDLVSITPDAFVAQVRLWHGERRAADAPSPDAVATAGTATTAGITTTAGIAITAGTATMPDTATSAPVEAPGGPRVTPAFTATSGASLHAAHRPGFWSGLRANLLVGLRVFFFRQVGPADIVSSFDQVVALLAIVLLVAAGLDRASAGVDAEFMYYGLLTWFAILLTGVWVSALIARSLSERADTRTFLVVGLATAPWAILLAWLLSYVPVLGENSTLFGSALVVIALWGGLRAARAAYGFLRPATLAVIVLSIFGVALGDMYLYSDMHLWSEASDDDADSQSQAWQNAESIFFDQPGFIDEAMARLAPQRPGVTDLYYLGFAGDGYQRVFRREALFGQGIFAERLGTRDRSLELINDFEDRDSFPLGTATGLRYAIMRMGEAMDPAEDVLVLFLTSHGSQDGISIRNGVTPFDSDLAPDEVRSALDDAGIRWRIVIVSACYAGVFVEPLKSDTTMILTASDSRNTSFGCADDRDLTYFGEAFLRDSLPRAPSLEAAFARAREQIAQREKQEKLTPSNPQMWVGASMSKKLQQLGPLPLGSGAPGARATSSPK